MGSRNLTIVVLNNEIKIAQYGHWGAYPDENGFALANWIKTEMNLDLFKKAVDKCAFITREEADKKIDEAFKEISVIKKIKNIFTNTFPKQELTERLSAGICPFIQNNGGVELVNDINFISSSVWNEWSYVLDLDSEQFEIYRGFNKEKLTENDRFYSYSDKGEIETDPDDGKRFYPLKMIKSFSFNELTIENYNKFVEDYYKEQEGEENGN